MIRSHNKYIVLQLSFIVVPMNSRDQYVIIGIGLWKISHQPCGSVCLKKALEMHYTCLNNAVPWLNKVKI